MFTLSTSTKICSRHQYGLVKKKKIKNHKIKNCFYIVIGQVTRRLQYNILGWTESKKLCWFFKLFSRDNIRWKITYFLKFGGRGHRSLGLPFKAATGPGSIEVDNIFVNALSVYAKLLFNTYLTIDSSCKFLIV